MSATTRSDEISPPGTTFCGFGAYVATEAVAGALPVGRNSPQKVPFGLYTEQLSGTAFTAPRHENRRSWLYRLQPSASHPPYVPYPRSTLVRSASFDEVPPTPNRLRWDPPTYPSGPVDFVDGLITYGGNGTPAAWGGCAIHLYAATSSMSARVFSSSDGELLVLPQEGRVRILTELGALTLSPLQIAVIPRGVRFRVELEEGRARGYVLENYGSSLAPSRARPDRRQWPRRAARLRDPRRLLRGPRRRMRDDSEVRRQAVGHRNAALASGCGRVARYLAPYRYDLRRFNTINSVSFDHPDPSIFTVLTSPPPRPRVPPTSISSSSAPLDGGGGDIPAAVVSSQRHERVHGPHRRRL